MSKSNIHKIYLASLERNITEPYSPRKLKEVHSYNLYQRYFTNLKKAVHHYNTAPYLRTYGFELQDYQRIYRIIKERGKFRIKAQYIPAGTVPVHIIGSTETYEIPKGPIDMTFIIKPYILE